MQQPYGAENRKPIRFEPLLTGAERLEIQSKIFKKYEDEYKSIKQEVVSAARARDRELQRQQNVLPPTRLQPGQYREAYRPDLPGVDTEAYQRGYYPTEREQLGREDRETDTGRETDAGREQREREQREREQREQEQEQKDEDHEQRIKPTANAPPVVIKPRAVPKIPAKPARRGRR